MVMRAGRGRNGETLFTGPGVSIQNDESWGHHAVSWSVIELKGQKKCLSETALGTSTSKSCFHVPTEPLLHSGPCDSQQPHSVSGTDSVPWSCDLKLLFHGAPNIFMAQGSMGFRAHGSEAWHQHAVFKCWEAVSSLVFQVLANQTSKSRLWGQWSGPLPHIWQGHCMCSVGWLDLLGGGGAFLLLMEPKASSAHTCWSCPALLRACAACSRCGGGPRVGFCGMFMVHSGQAEQSHPWWVLP